MTDYIEQKLYSTLESQGLSKEAVSWTMQAVGALPEEDVLPMAMLLMSSRDLGMKVWNTAKLKVEALRGMRDANAVADTSIQMTQSALAELE